jgi:hypothetical protein
MLLLPLFVVACETVETAPLSDSKEAAASAESLSTDAGKTDQSSETDELGGQEAALPPAPPPVDDNPERFLGLAPVALSQELGEPHLKRREDIAEVWQYRREDCVLDVFLYEDGSIYKVAYLEARDLSAEPVETRACLRGLLEARQHRQSS